MNFAETSGHDNAETSMARTDDSAVQVASHMVQCLWWTVADAFLINPFMHIKVWFVESC